MLAHLVIQRWNVWVVEPSQTLTRLLMKKTNFQLKIKCAVFYVELESLDEVYDVASVSTKMLIHFPLTPIDCCTAHEWRTLKKKTVARKNLNQSNVDDFLSLTAVFFRCLQCVTSNLCWKKFCNFLDFLHFPILKVWWMELNHSILCYSKKVYKTIANSGKMFNFKLFF